VTNLLDFISSLPSKPTTSGELPEADAPAVACVLGPAPTETIPEMLKRHAAEHIEWVNADPLCYHSCSWCGTVHTRERFHPNGSCGTPLPRKRAVREVGHEKGETTTPFFTDANMNQPVRVVKRREKTLSEQWRAHRTYAIRASGIHE